MKKTDLAYLAGIMDGEGCIYIRCTNPHFRAANLVVDVGSTDEWICQLLKFAFGGKVYCTENKKNPHKLWRWVVSGNQASNCLQLLIPYLHLKRPQAELAIKFQSRKAKPFCRGNPKPESIFVLEQADAILLKKLKKQDKVMVSPIRQETKLD